MAKKKSKKLDLSNIPEQQQLIIDEIIQPQSMAEFAQQKFVEPDIVPDPVEEQPASIPQQVSNELPEQDLKQQIIDKIQQVLQTDDLDKPIPTVALSFLSRIGLGKSDKDKPKIQAIQQKVQQQLAQAGQQTYQQKQQITQEIKDEIAQQVAEMIDSVDAEEDVDLLLKAKKIVNEVETITEQEVEALVNTTDVVSDFIEAEVEEENQIEVKAAIIEAAKEIPDFDIDDVLDIEVSELSGKGGYYKTKVNISSAIGGTIMSKLATNIKGDSQGKITHRQTDFRVIGNTNKTQLRGSTLKLQKTTFTFRPPSEVAKKGTRVMISLYDDFNQTKKALVYIQKSRSKFIKEFTLDMNTYEWLGKFIESFFVDTFEVSKQRLNLYNQDNDPKQTELINLLNVYTRTKQFEVKPIQDPKDESVMIGFLIKYNGKENPWLMFDVKQHAGGYIIKGKSLVKRRWTYSMNYGPNKETIFPYELMANGAKMLPALVRMYELDWKETFGVDMTEDAWEYFDFKLTYRELKGALTFFMTMEDEDRALTDVNIIETLSKKDTLQALRENGLSRFTQYEVETIIGTARGMEYFALSYLGAVGKGDDKRAGRQYITTDEYYQKYHVNDKRDYDFRQRTVMKKGEMQRNYDTRKFSYQLEYVVDGEKKYLHGNDYKSLLKQANIIK